MLTPKSIGIEIADDHIKIVCLQAGPAGIKVSAQTRIALSADRPEARLAAAGTSIKDFLDRHDPGSAEVFLCIPTVLTVMRTIELPLALRENLQETIGYEMEKFVPFPADTVYFNASIIKEDKQNNTLTALLTVIKKTTLDPFLVLPVTIGEISGIQDNGCATANAAVYLENIADEQNWAILFYNGSTFNLALMLGKNLQYAREWQATDNFAEELTQELTALLKPLAPSNEPLQLVVCGPRDDTDLIPTVQGIQGFAARPLDLKPAGLSSPELLPAFGAALMGFGKAATQVNLLPLALRKSPSRFGIYSFLILFAMTIITGLAWGGSYMIRQQLMADELDDELSRLRAEVVKIEEIRDETKIMAEQIQALNTLRVQRISLLKVLRELSRKVPETAWLRSLTIKKQAILLDGFANSATELIPMLETSPMFEDVVFKSTITKRRDGKEIFKIALNIHAAQKSD